MRRGAGWTALALAAALGFCAGPGARTAAALEPPRWVSHRFVPQRAAVGLVWTAVPGAARYLVLRRSAAEAEPRQITATPGLQYLDTAVERGARYRYSVRAEGTGGTGPASVEVEVLALEAELAPPEAPRLTNVVGEDRGGDVLVRLLWTQVTGALIYNVHRRDAGEPEGGFRLIASVSDVSHLDTSVAAGRTYEYRISATSKALVEGAPSEVRSVKLPAAAAAAPTRVAPQAIRVRASREVLALRGNQRLPIKAPVDLAAGADGTVYVLDNQLPGVLVFGPGGAFLRVIGGAESPAEGRLLRPYGIALDAEGTVWVTDHRQRSVIVAYDAESGRVRETIVFEVPPRPEALDRLPPRTRGEQPFALDLDFLPGGEMVVTDNTFGRVCVLGRRGALVSEFGLPGQNTGEFNRPSKIAIDPEGRIFVLDAQNKRVQAFDGDGKFLYEIGRSAAMAGSFIGLSGVAWDAGGALFVADSPMATVQVFDRGDGSYRYHVGREDRALEEGKTRPLWDVVNPAGLALDPVSGRLWIGLPSVHAISVRELLPLPEAPP